MEATGETRAEVSNEVSVCRNINICVLNKSISLLVVIIVQMSTFFINVSINLTQNGRECKNFLGGMPPGPLVICALHVTVLSPLLKVL